MPPKMRRYSAFADLVRILLISLCILDCSALDYDQVQEERRWVQNQDGPYFTWKKRGQLFPDRHYRNYRNHDDVSSEIMLRRIRAQQSDCWPHDKFGLFQTTEGCPSGGWSSGEVRHRLKPGSSVSTSSYLNAQINREDVTLRFCIRDPDNHYRPEEAYCAHSESTFPPGSYCIFNGQPKPNIYERCPADFAWSAIGIDDSGTTVADRTSGAVPTGEFFPTFSHYYFCCRNDSSADEAIYLPRTQSFILLPLSSEQKCQQVHGMRSQLFSMFLDCESGSYVNHPNKLNAPFVITDIVVEGVGSCSREKRGKGVQLHLCHYTRW